MSAPATAASAAYVTVGRGVRVPVSQAPCTQRCTACSQVTDHDDIRPLRYRRGDGVPGLSYPLCGRCRPEKIARLERMGFVMTPGGDEVPS